MRIGLPYTADDLVGITLELLRKCNYREDAYVRPIAYKSSPVIGVRLHDLEDSLTVFAVPFGTYIDIDRGISCSVSSWRRTDDNAIPARSKITGAQISPVTSIDHRAIGRGERGPITAKVSQIYFDAVRGKVSQYRSWVTPVYKR